MATNPQLHPLEVNSHTGEPFLRLTLHKDIILTPPRPGDVKCYPPILNDPKVHRWMLGPPIPYLPEHAEAWFASIKPLADALLSLLEAAKDNEHLITASGCPVRAIRELKAGGEDIYLGELSLTRCTDGELLSILGGFQDDDEQKVRCVSENCERTAGDPKIIWTIGDYLGSSHHSQGIMTDAVETLLSNWAVPRMGVHQIIAPVFRGNEGSVKVFQKNGFKLMRTFENYVEVRGEKRDLHVLEWDSGRTYMPSSA